jgi:hypothetical protein
MFASLQQIKNYIECYYTWKEKYKFYASGTTNIIIYNTCINKKAWATYIKQNKSF